MRKARETVPIVAAVVVLASAACGTEGGRSTYSNNPDSGAVAPAMRLDTSMTRSYPESTAGGPQRTGKPGGAGDTLSTRGQPAGTTGVRMPDTTRKRP